MSTYFFDLTHLFAIFLSSLVFILSKAPIASFTGSDLLWRWWAKNRWWRWRFEGFILGFCLVMAYFYLVLFGWLSALSRFAMFGQFHIRTLPHDVFTREGNDLRTTVTIILIMFFSSIMWSFHHFALQFGRHWKVEVFYLHISMISDPHI